MKTFAKAIASLVNYSTGPKTGEPAKLKPGTTIETEGTQPGNGAKISAEEHNYLSNNLQKRMNALQLSKLRNFVRRNTLFNTQKPPMRIGVDPLDGMCVAQLPNTGGGVIQTYVLDCVSPGGLSLTDFIEAFGDSSTTDHSGQAAFYVPVDDVNGTGRPGLYCTNRDTETAVEVRYITNNHGSDTPTTSIIGNRTIPAGASITYGIKAGDRAIFSIQDTSTVDLDHLYSVSTGASPAITDATVPSDTFSSSPNFRANNVLAYNPNTDRAVFLYHDVTGSGEVRVMHSDDRGLTWSATSAVTAFHFPYDVQYVEEWGPDNKNVFMAILASGGPVFEYEIWTSEDGVAWSKEIDITAPSNYKSANCAVLLGDLFICLTGSSGRGVYVEDLVSGKSGVFNYGKLGETGDGTIRITTDHDRTLLCLSRADLEDATEDSFAVNLFGETGGFEF